MNIITSCAISVTLIASSRYEWLEINVSDDNQIQGKINISIYVAVNQIQLAMVE